MPRPKKNRWIQCHPNVTYYKPQGIPLRTLEQVFIGVDEFEAIRLADMEGLSQEEAAKKMNISRATFGRVVAEGHKKIATALVKGNAIRIEGGEVEIRPPQPPYGYRKGQHRHGRGGHNI